MSETRKPLGTIITKYVKEMEIDIEEILNNISKNGEEWAINIDYKFEFSPERKIRDYFIVTVIPYIDDKKQGTYQFKFKSIESISLNEICEVMYEIILTPEKSNDIIESSKVNIEYLI